MSREQLVYDPTAPSRHGGRAIGRPLQGLDGKIVGFIDNAKPNFDLLVEELAVLFTRHYGVRQVLTRRKRGAAMPAPVDFIERLAADCDVVITGSGD